MSSAAASSDYDPYTDAALLFFQEPGVAETDMEADVDRFIRVFLYTISGDIVADGVHQNSWDGYFPKGQGLVEQLVRPDDLAHRRRRGLLCLGVLPYRIPGRSQLVPQHQGAADNPGKTFPRAGHWLQQERAPEVNQQLVAFLTSL